MKISGRGKLEELKAKHADVGPHVDSWLQEVKEEQWNTPHDVKARYISASILKDKIVIFNINGNHYRIKAKIDYANKVMLIVKAGTHVEYMKW